MYGAQTHTCTYCKLSPVCLPSSLLLSISLYLCLTLFFLSVIITHYSVQSKEQSSFPSFLLAFLPIPLSVFPAFTAVITSELETFDQPEPNSL